MEQDREYRDALRMGLRRAGLHWLRAGYEVVAGVGALLTEVVEARKRPDEEDPGSEDDRPIRIELD
ncbi:MAG: hypothetical protein WBV06_20935 [Acidimicrobiia bacterium]